ncbi:RNA pseudouridine synthase [Spirochaetia bacterium]|nr:RNA pseudouridine synthase [Spirochaetia bacterium]
MMPIRDMRPTGRLEQPIDESRIVYQSDACMVINKLPGESAEGSFREGAGKGMIDLPRLLTEQFGVAEGAFTAVHRLDVPVSGCTLFARTPAALSFLNAAFAAGRVQKHYWAIVEMPDPGMDLPSAETIGRGSPPETGELIHWLETDRRQNKSIAFSEKGPGRKRAILRYRISGRGINYLFMEIELVTGRHHQIRAQLASLGLHIKGDLKYGAKRSEKAGGIRLHAHSLRFPATGEYIMVRASPPLRDRLWEDFEKSLPPRN